MARVNGGFLGNLSGSVGNVTFARARGGIQTARVKTSPSNPRSLAGVTITDASPSVDDPDTYVLTVDSPTGGADADYLVGIIYNGHAWAAAMTDNGTMRGDEQVEILLPPAGQGSPMRSSPTHSPTAQKAQASSSRTATPSR